MRLPPPSPGPWVPGVLVLICAALAAIAVALAVVK